MTRFYYDPSRLLREEVGSSSSETNVAKVPDIASRDALDTSIYKIAQVEDATADPTVDTGGALYYYSSVTNQWIKGAEDESLDLILDWNNINGRPNRTAGDIEQAVDYRHEHNNFGLLENFNVTVDGKSFTNNGVILGVPWNTLYDLPDNIANCENLYVLDDGNGNYSLRYNLADYIKTDWSNLVNKPTSTVGQIDDAVNLKHVHNNNTELDRLTSNHVDILDNLSINISTGELYYSGNKVLTEPYQPQYSTVEW